MEDINIYSIEYMIKDSDLKRMSEEDKADLIKTRNRLLQLLISNNIPYACHSSSYDYSMKMYTGGLN